MEKLDSSLLAEYEDPLKKYFLFQKQLIKKGIRNLTFNEINNIDIKDPILSKIIYGDILYYGKFLNEKEALENYLEALKKSKLQNNSNLSKEIIRKVIIVLSNNRENYKLISRYIKEYKNLASNQEDYFYLNFHSNIFYADSLRVARIKQLEDNLEKNIHIDNDFLKAKHYQMIGVFYFYFKKDITKALENMLLAKKYLKKKKYRKFKIELFGVYGNIAQYYQTLNKNKLADFFFSKAYKIDLPKHRYLQKIKLSEHISKKFYKQKKYNQSYITFIKSLRYVDTLLSHKNDEFAIINDLNIKYQTEKKEKENLRLKQDNLISEQKRKQNRNLLYGSLVFIGLGGTITYLTLKNSKRKRQLAEQQKELEKQKNITLIKEQEITTINAMIDGQEKERVRIAEDLHDNIGSVLATLKLHFENLKLNREKKHFNQEELYEKTEDLIDETYQKVRNIAHAKNAGVIANKGLLVAVKIMAEKISTANKIKIEVLNFGLNKRLENNLEIAVFRIIQELTTNIIKHAEAKNATINISQFDNTLNIIIEDDGKGFDYKNVNIKNGMGLNSIKTRIEHLNGTLNIDSTLKKGTSIIINIPLI